jgi:hypothetical protein
VKGCKNLDLIVFSVKIFTEKFLHWNETDLALLRMRLLHTKILFNRPGETEGNRVINYTFVSFEGESVSSA